MSVKLTVVVDRRSDSPLLAKPHTMGSLIQTA